MAEINPESKAILDSYLREQGLQSLRWEDHSTDEKDFILGMSSKFVEQIIHFASSNKVYHMDPPLAISWLKNNQFNAHACSIGINVICIEYDVITVLYNFFSRLFSMPEIFLSLGDAKRESFERGLIGSSDDVIDSLKDEILMEPICESRKILAQWCFTQAVKFIFLHEFIHIWNGHTSLLYKETGLKMIDELSHASGANLDGLDSQTMEMDADCAAAGILMMAVQFPELDISHYDDQTKLTDFEPEQSMKLTRLSLTFFSMYAVFKCFDEEIQTVGDEHDEHPSAPIRAMSIEAAVKKTIKRNLGLSAEQVGQIFAIAKTEGDKAFGWMFERAVPTPAFQAELVQKGAPRVNAMLERWASLRPLLAPLAKGELVAVSPEVGRKN